MNSGFAILCLSTLLCFVAAEPGKFFSRLSKEDYTSVNDKVASFPGFPKSYEVEYDFYLPYTDVFSPSPVRYPIHMWIDGEDTNNTKIRIDDNDGLNKEFSLPNGKYIVHPRMDKQVCTLSTGDHAMDVLMGKERGLPHDMGNWTYMGPGVYEGKECDTYQLTETFFERTAYYTLYISKEQVPLFLSAIGQNYFTGAHFDEYLAYFKSYVPGVPDPAIFDLPPQCEDPMITEGLSLVIQMNCLVPRVIQGHDDYDQFLSRYGRMHSSPIEYRSRLDIYLENKQLVDQHNQRNDASYILELNKFSDYTEEEFRALNLGMSGVSGGDMCTRACWFVGHLEETEEVRALVEKRAKVFEDRTNEEIPSNFSWYGTGADGVVKDQAVCGTCWAFAAIQAMQGAWYVATNESLSFSEQQMADCSWPYYNHACAGGFVVTGILYAIDEGGIASEFTYPYKGVDDYCLPFTPIAQFEDLGVIEAHQPEMMKAALNLYGPLGVSMDAGHLEFRFFKSGIFSFQNCTNSTNHAVAIVGYGTEDGMDYWLVKNSWSTFWGDKGYIKIDMQYDCGLSTRPVFAIADSEAAKQRKAELQSMSLYT